MQRRATRGISSRGCGSIGSVRLDSLGAISQLIWIAEFHWPTFAVGLGGITFLFFLKWVTWYFPGVRWMRYISSILLLVVLSTFVCFLGGLDQKWKLQILGGMQPSLPVCFFLRHR